MTLMGLVDLQRKYSIAQNRLTALKAAKGKNWGSFKDEVAKSMTNLSQAVDALESRL